MKIPVQGTNFVKDTKNGALLTINPKVLQENEARMKLKAKLNFKNDEINKLKDDVEVLKENITDIKNMLQQLIKRD